MISFLCACGKKIKVDEKYGGKKGKCPNCGKIVDIPKGGQKETPMKAVICSKCRHEQKVPASLTNKIFICENCGSSTLPASKKEDPAEFTFKDNESYTVHYEEDFSSSTPYNPDLDSLSGYKRVSNINRAFVPERFSQYLSLSESIRFASNPSITALILKLISPVFGLFLFLVSSVFIPSEERFEGYSLATAGVVLVSLIIIAAMIFSWKFTYYIVTDKKVFSSSGIFNRRITIIPLANVHTISVNTGIIDSILGLNSIVFSSAGNGGQGFIFRWFPFMTSGTLVFKYIKGAPEICRFMSE